MGPECPWAWPSSILGLWQSFSKPTVNISLPSFCFEVLGQLFVAPVVFPIQASEILSNCPWLFSTNVLGKKLFALGKLCQVKGKSCELEFPWLSDMLANNNSLRLGLFCEFQTILSPQWLLHWGGSVVSWLYSLWITASLGLILSFEKWEFFGVCFFFGQCSYCFYERGKFQKTLLYHSRSNSTTVDFCI